ncbi:MAG TPA: chromate efflux transporter [Candidatus Didemnitutus sp.]|nr:chromate efflux transporter [Candidatus Didemnitutus sp.]
MPSAGPGIPTLFFAALRLGCTSFGGPIAHLGYFRHEYVQRRKWLSESEYAELVAFCQFLPGPASSQVGFGVGLLQRGWLGGLAAWLGFTLPSAVLMTVFAYGVGSLTHPEAAGWLAGLRIAAAAVVGQAVVAMWRNLCGDLPRSAIAAAAALTTLHTSAVLQPLLLAVGGLIGWRVLRVTPKEPSAAPSLKSRHSGVCLATFFVLLTLLPIAAHFRPDSSVAVADRMFRGGSLIFGGGHAVVPILGQQVVAEGWISEERFFSGYGFTQAMPGPLFTFAAYLGASFRVGMGGWLGATWALAWIFLPGLLLVGGLLPFWQSLRGSVGMQSAVAGVNAAIVGLLFSAWIDPLATTSLLGWREVALAAAGWIGLQYRIIPAWLVVLASAGAGALLL